MKLAARSAAVILRPQPTSSQERQTPRARLDRCPCYQCAGSASRAAMARRPSPSTPLLAAVLLLLAPLLPAREFGACTCTLQIIQFTYYHRCLSIRLLTNQVIFFSSWSSSGGSSEQHVVRSPLTLPASDGEGDGAVVTPELGALLPLPGGRAALSLDHVLARHGR